MFIIDYEIKSILLMFKFTMKNCPYIVKFVYLSILNLSVEMPIKKNFNDILYICKKNIGYLPISVTNAYITTRMLSEKILNICSRS